MSDAVLLGYTTKQWAIMFGRYPLKDPTMAGLCDCRKQWMLAHTNDPGEVSIIGCAPPEDWDAVHRVLSAPLPWSLAA